ncbi:MAG: lactate racemase domain-containing protein [Pirellulales bacterium]
MFSIRITRFDCRTDASIAELRSRRSHRHPADRRACGGIREGRRTDRSGSRVAARLDQPLDFPALAKAIVPDDQIVLALGDDVPAPARLVAGVVAYLQDHGVTPEQIRVLRTQAEEARGQDPLADCSDDVRAAIRLVTHHPERRGDLAYLAADAAAEPIYFQRCLIEADLIIPVLAAARPGQRHSPTGLYPIYADDSAQDRHRSAGKPAVKKKGTKKSPEPIAPEDDEPLDSLLCVQFAIRAVAVDDRHPTKILAGECLTVDRAATAAYGELCTVVVGAPRQTLVAGVPSDVPLTWRRFSELVTRLMPHVRADGDLVICADLDPELPEALRSWAASSWLDEVLDELRTAEIPGWRTVVELAAARDHARIYLVSNLPSAAVEDLGFAPIATTEELARVLGDGRDALIVPNADRMTLVE